MIRTIAGTIAMGTLVIVSVGRVQAQQATFHIDRAIANWVGFRAHVQKIDGNMTASFPNNDLRLTVGMAGFKTKLTASNWITNLDPQFPISGRLLEASQQLTLTVIGPLSEFDTAMFTIYAITHVEAQRSLVPSDYLFFGTNLVGATPKQWFHATTGAGAGSPLFATSFIARPIGMVSVNLPDHGPPSDAKIPEPLSFGIWGGGVLCGVIGVVTRRRRIRAGG